MSIRKRGRMFVEFAAVFGLLFLVSGNIQASAIYSCGGGADCNGNLYAVSVLSHLGDTYQLELDIDVQSTYTGNHWTDLVGAVALKDFVSSYSNFSLVSAPNGASNWFLSQNELNANGLTGGNSGGLGAEAKAPYTGAAVSNAGVVLSWVFQFDSTNALNSTSHIKYLYENSSDKKVGSLGSWDIGIQSPTTAPVSEPATMFLLGSALVGLAAYGSKKYFKK